MAKLFPDKRNSRVIFQSSAEEQFYELCKQQLSDRWRVYYSCNLTTAEKGEGLREGEIDFVLYHPEWGAIVIEVKGGRIRYDAKKGEFCSINRHGESFIIQNPFHQALVWKSRFVRYIRKNRLKVPVSHAVCLPAVHEDHFPASAGAEPKIIIGRERMKDLERTLKELVTFSQPKEYLNFKNCDSELDRLLIGSNFISKLYLRDYIDSHNLRVVDFEVIQETLITPIASSQRLGIEGEAGTGKTMLAIYLARRFRDQGKRVLLLSSNSLLNSYLKREVGQEVLVETYADFAKSFHVDLLRPSKSFAGSREDWIQYEAPDRLKKAIESRPKNFDVLLCDEAQDVQPFWWESFEKIIDADEGHIYLFFDRSQGIFGSGGKESRFVPEDVLPVAAPYFPLIHNYRTTREIAGYARKFRTGGQVLQSHCGRIGYIPRIITYKDEEDCRRQLSRLTKNLIRDEGLRLNELTLISARNPVAKESVLHNVDRIAHYPLLHLHGKTSESDWRNNQGRIVVTTIPSFKGLETPVAILLNLSEHGLPISNPMMSSLMYVAMTRAKHMLYLMVKEDDAKSAELVQALAGLEDYGSITIGGTDANFEFSGVVTHYNPDRVGWLQVDDPAFEKNSIMFFPFDVSRAALSNIRVGSKIKFVPRMEGNTTIASDLKIANDS